MYYVYLSESISVPGRRYVGYTADLRQRLADHNAGKLITTAKARPWRLETYLAFSSKRRALKFERYLKSGSGHAFAAQRLWAGRERLRESQPNFPAPLTDEGRSCFRNFAPAVRVWGASAKMLERNPIVLSRAALADCLLPVR